MDLDYYNFIPYTFTGAFDLPSSAFARSNDLAVIAINKLISPTISNQSESISSTTYFPSQLIPNVTPTPVVARISNGANNIGCVYLDSQMRIHISGGPGLGTPFTAGSINAGLPYGAIITYRIS